MARARGGRCGGLCGARSKEKADRDALFRAARDTGAGRDPSNILDDAEEEAMPDFTHFEAMDKERRAARRRTSYSSRKQYEEAEEAICI